MVLWLNKAAAVYNALVPAHMDAIDCMVVLEPVGYYLALGAGEVVVREVDML